MFTPAPPLTSGSAGAASRSDHLLEPVLDAIRQLGGVLEGESNAHVLAQIRPLVPKASGRALSSALWKLVHKKRLVFAIAPASHRDPEPRARGYRLFETNEER